MPNWKKVITSGSTAILNEITSSGGITGDLKLQQELETNQTVGGVSSGTTFDQGSSVETLLRSILITFLRSSISNVRLKNNGSDQSISVREVNDSIPTDQFRITATANSPNGLLPINLTLTGSGATTGNFEKDFTSTTLSSGTNDITISPDETLNISNIASANSARLLV